MLTSDNVVMLTSDNVAMSTSTMYRVSNVSVKPKKKKLEKCRLLSPYSVLSDYQTHSSYLIVGVFVNL